MQLGKHINISEPLEPEEGEEERNETSQEPLELEERERWCWNQPSTIVVYCELNL